MCKRLVVMFESGYPFSSGLHREPPEQPKTRPKKRATEPRHPLGPHRGELRRHRSGGYVRRQLGPETNCRCRVLFGAKEKELSVAQCTCRCFKAMSVRRMCVIQEIRMCKRRLCCDPEAKPAEANNISAGPKTGADLRCAYGGKIRTDEHGSPKK